MPPLPDPSSHPYVYVLRCADNSFYVGQAKNIRGRLAEHNSARGGASTRVSRPFTLVHIEGPYMAARAAARELQLKGWSPAKTESLIRRSSRARERLSREIAARGGWCASGDVRCLKTKTEQQLREHLSMLQWDEKLSGRSPSEWRQPHEPLLQEMGDN